MKKIISIVLSLLLAFTAIFSTEVEVNAANNDTLLNTYGKVFGKVGNALKASEILNGNILNYAKKDYNSITAENEMKPDAILGYSPNLISIAEAKSLGYYIPDNYPESMVPRLDFSNVDKMLKACYDNGLSMRGHTLVWHSQTPSWYFKNGYNNYSSYVSQQVMNKRMEFYIKTVMGHIHSSKYSSVVYAWDVVNEYLHASNSGSGWQVIYGNNLGTRANFVKLAFQYAYETLEYFGLTNKVKLFYNDYNTYMEVNEVIDLINYINSGKKICAGIGMQSHLSTTYPSVAYYKAAVDAFARAGFEIQVTELDVGNTSSKEQAQYYYDLMSALISSKKAGANITAIVWWGLSDEGSWRKSEQPLLYSNYTTPKEAYYSVLNAYYNAGYTSGSGNESNGGNTNTSNTLSDGWYYIKNVNAQKYLQVANNTGKAVQNVELGTGTGVAGQKWYLKNVGNGYVTLESALGNYMLDVASGENKDGANIQIYNSHSGTAQKFSLKPSTKNGEYFVYTMCSNGSKVLDAYNFGTSDGTNVCQWTYGGNSNQIWVFEKTSY